ncbi:MAG: NAD-dependent DNA ligase LigA [Erysipelotrichaceae bacterium]
MENRIKELRKLLNEYAYQYYVLDNATISDYDYDQLYHELEQLELQYPQFDDDNSITKKVGGKVLDSFNKITHNQVMLSLGNAFSYEDLLAFDQRVVSEVGKVQYMVEVKIDGLAMSVTYKNGKFVQGVTRGDGLVGEDVSSNVKTIRSLPLEISFVKDLEIRGEVFMAKSTLQKINDQRETLGLDLFMNCRNAAAGSIRQLDSKVAASRNLDAFWYYVPQGEELGFTKHSDSLNYLDELGFKTNNLRKLCNSIEEVYEYIQYMDIHRDELSYDIDGMVIKVDDLEKQKLLGNTIKVPKWAIAYKFKAQEVESEILDIFLSVGRTGKITPNAQLKSVLISGSNVSFAQLHNEDYIRNKDIRIKDKVLVRKAGEIIPEVYQVILEKRPNDAIIYDFPKSCPSCGSPIYRLEDESDYYCINTDCPSRIIGSIVHFSSKECFDIDSLGERTITILLENGWVKSIEDLFTLDKFKEQIIEFPGFGLKSYQKIIDGIEDSKKKSLESLIYSLGIRHIGKKASLLLAKHFLDLFSLMTSSFEQLSEIKDIGDISAKSIINYFTDDKNKRLVQCLIDVGYNTLYLGKSDENTIFSNKVVVLTGTLVNYNRKELTDLLQSLGANVTSSVSKKTDMVIFGAESGSKLEKATKLGVKCINEDQLLELLGQKESK